MSNGLLNKMIFTWHFRQKKQSFVQGAWVAPWLPYGNKGCAASPNKVTLPNRKTSMDHGRISSIRWFSRSSPRNERKWLEVDCDAAAIILEVVIAVDKTEHVDMSINNITSHSLPCLLSSRENVDLHSEHVFRFSRDWIFWPSRCHLKRRETWLFRTRCKAGMSAHIMNKMIKTEANGSEYWNRME